MIKKKEKTREWLERKGYRFDDPSMSNLNSFCQWLEKENRQNWEIERAVEELLKETIEILS